MREYSLFTGPLVSQQRERKEGNKAIRVAIDSTVKQVKSEREKDTTEKKALIHRVVQLHVKPVLVQYRSLGADDTEPRELIALELSKKLDVHISTSLI